MLDDITPNQIERLVSSFEAIAIALKGIHEETKNAGTRFWPERREQRPAILTRVETEEDKIKKSQGASRRPISEWLNPESEDDDGEYIGERERQWLVSHPRESKPSAAGAKDAVVGGQEGSGAQETGRKAGRRRKSTSDNPTA
jgi:hypothetical protein